MLKGQLRGVSVGSAEVTLNPARARNTLESSPFASVTASYANVDFVSVPEPYKIVQSMQRLHNDSKRGSMVQMIDHRSGSLLENRGLDSGIVIRHGKTFLNENRGQFMNRMQSQPSQAHAEALKLFEEHNSAILEMKMKSVVEKTESQMAETNAESII